MPEITDAQRNLFGQGWPLLFILGGVIDEDLVTDERLKNVVMSFYWSGYYLGLYQGQKGAEGQDSDLKS